MEKSAAGDCAAEQQAASGLLSLRNVLLRLLHNRLPVAENFQGIPQKRAYLTAAKAAAGHFQRLHLDWEACGGEAMKQDSHSGGTELQTA